MESHQPRRRREQTLIERFFWVNHDLEKSIQKITEVDETDKDITRLRSEVRHHKRRMLEYLKAMVDDAVPIELKNTRSFRLKYTDEIRTEGLEGQLWQAVEVLGSGQVILHRENMSETLRPLAMSLLDELTTVRYAAAAEYLNPEYAQRRKAIQRKRPTGAAAHSPSPPLLSMSTSGEASFCGGGVSTSTQTMASYSCDGPGCSSQGGEEKESASGSYYSDGFIQILAHIDNLMAEFEWEYMSLVVRKLRSSVDAEDLQEAAVLFSEAVRWAKGHKLITYAQVAECDTQLMVALPRLAVLLGCRVFHEGLFTRTLDKDPEKRPFIFRKFSSEVNFLRRHLGALTKREYLQLARYLALVEETPEKFPVKFISDDEDEESDICLDSTSPTRVGATSGGTASDCDKDEPSPSPQRRCDKPVHRCQRKTCPRKECRDRRKRLKRLGMSEGDTSGPVKRGDMQSLFKLVSHISDMLQSEFAAEYRFLMQAVFVLYQDCEDEEEHEGKEAAWEDCWLEGQGENGLEPSLDALTLLGCTEEEELEIFRKVEDRLTARTIQSSDSCNSLSQTDWLNSRIVSGVLVRQEERPPWQSDDVPDCSHCEKKFSLFRRRHHCRRCGYIFCGSCWGARYPIPQMGVYQRVPVCVECALILELSS